MQLFDPESFDPKPRSVVRHPEGVAVLSALLPPGAACDGDIEWMDATFETAHPEMRRTCAACPIRNECGEWGIAHEPHGMWGGLTPYEREQIRNERGQLLVEIHYGYRYGIGVDRFAIRTNADHLALRREQAEWHHGLTHPLNGVA